jgi:glycosyltransferase involved in cell wall biosynthesis
VNSRTLPEQLRLRPARLIETKTTTLSTNDFFEREDTCHAQPYRLLYCGRMAVEKGLLDLIEALAIVVAGGSNVILDLVGPCGAHDGAVDQISFLAERRGISKRVCFRGYKPLGPELFKMYQGADVFIIPSKFEGFPRAAWEAMAQSVPVIATRVGSIPHFLKHLSSAYLVEPSAPDGLANAIGRLISEPALRRCLIKGGMRLAKENTLDRRAQEMVSAIEQWIPENACVGRTRCPAIFLA